MGKKILCIFGTRPEAIKMAPVILELKKISELQSIVCITAQHRQMLDQVLNLFSIIPDIDLNLMTPNQSLSEITSKVIKEIDHVIKEIKPDVILVQGDTTTVMAGAMAAFYNRVPIGHVEAGLRSNNIYSPYPEEFNRRVVSLFTEYHFAPTKNAQSSLLKEGVSPNKIYITGNTVIDALYIVRKKPMPKLVNDLLERIGNDKRILLVTAHRRENFGERFVEICLGLKELIGRNKEIAIVYPVHLNPNVRKPVFEILQGLDRVFLIDPVEYDALVHLMNASYLVLTDSGGIQEEAPSLGKPVLVMRTETERPEGIEAGTAKLVGPFRDRIIEETEKLLYSEVEYQKMAKAVNPYGDGNAAKRIVQVLVNGQEGDTYEQL